MPIVHTPAWGPFSSPFQPFPLLCGFPLIFPRQRCHSNGVSCPPCLPAIRATPASVPSESTFLKPLDLLHF
uniref:Uncharacterized protein n=1 Tax=Malurus cyaneus samueli TaxID=2593467 RepID=A0A8C5WZW6_9PASS